MISLVLGTNTKGITIPVRDPSFSMKEYDKEEMHPSPTKEKENEKGKAKTAEPYAPLIRSDFALF